MNDEVGEIKERLPLVDYISSHVTTKRRGKNFVACCPFHNEKTPSFYIYTDSNNYYCFGCQRGGDLFSFVMEYENVDFKEALTNLARQAGVTLSQNGSSRVDTRERDERWDKIMETAQEFFKERYRSDAGAKAREYMKKRGFSESTIEKYEIGYSLDSWNGLINYCQQRAITNKELETLGLVKQSEKGSYFDFFRDRVMFPVRTANQRLVGFGGRILGEGEPKYLNSPDTPLFNKSHLLYGMNIAKEQIRQTGTFLLMEGYTDVMMSEQFALGAATATLGTAMGEDHVRQIKRYTSTIYLVYDGDKAGQKAMERSLPFFIKHGLDARSITLPEGLDPCEFLLTQENWKNTWDKLSHESTDVFNFKLNRLIQAQEPLSPESITNIAATMVEDLRSCRDPIRLNVYSEQLAQKLNISSDAIQQKLNSQSSFQKKNPVKKIERVMPENYYRKDDSFFLLSLTIANQKFISDLEEHFHTLELPTTPTCVLLKKWMDAHQGAEEIALPSFKSTLAQEDQLIFDQAMIQEIPPPDMQLRMFYEKIDQLRKPESKAEIKKQLSEAIKANNREEVRKLTRRLQKHASN